MEGNKDTDAPVRDADVLISENKLHSKEVRCELSRLKATKGMVDYQYDDLGTPQEDKSFLKKHLDKKRFRLLELQPGLLNNPQVVCEIFEVELDITDGTVVRVVDDSPQYADTEATSDAKQGDDRVDSIKRLKLKERERSQQRCKENMSYEALSWRWGNEQMGEYAIMVLKGKLHFRKRVSRTLGLALKYLRYRAHPRILWIDALCINQADHEERSFQVAMMDRLYTGASQVAIWLGEDEQGDESRTAIGFIKNDVSVLKEFDKLCRDTKYTDQWKALLVLMQREWFSRRWVVQEIALAKKATVHYGPDKIGWRQLATAIGLFVEVESATHRLSELMKSDERFNLIPNWFEHISGLPASLLVNESSRVFRDYKEEEEELSNSHTSLESAQSRHESNLDPWMLEDPSDQDDTDEEADVVYSVSLANHIPGTPSGSDDHDSLDDSYYHYPVTDKMRRSLLTLEYLVTSLAIFDCGPPHDSLYALVAISRDAFPSPPIPLNKRNKEVLLTEVMEGFVERKPFPLDYNMSYPDVCRCFVEFCIRRREASDQTTALDILCRPWSKDWTPHDDDGYVMARELHKPVVVLERDSGQCWKVFDREEKRTYDELVQKSREPGRPQYSVYKSIYRDWRTSRSNTSSDTMKAWKHKVLEQGKGIISLENIDRKWALWLPYGKLRSSPEFWRRWEEGDNKTPQGQQGQERDKPSPNVKASLGLPSWVARISNARFDIFRHPGMDMVKMGRKNADPLVGSLENNAGIYRAAHLTKVDSKSLRFKKREIQPNGLSHYSLYVKGFIIDKVKHVSHVSSAGVIPESWLRLAKWDKAINPDQFGEDPGEPPDNFWRTLVADRGTSSNPPYYYARACRETVMRGGLRSGAVDTMALKSYERNSIIAEFCRRVQSVIWNRAMIMTDSGKLGLVSNSVKEGDLICILYGCSVPVILRRESRKDVKMRIAEQIQDSLEAMKSVTKSCIKRRALRAQYKKRKEEDEDHEKFVKDALQTYWERSRRDHGVLTARPEPSNGDEPTPAGIAEDEKDSARPETSPTTNSGKARPLPHFNQIKNMDGLTTKELLACWPSYSKTEGKEVPDDDNLSEDDFADKKKKAKNSSRWGRVWMQRVARERAAQEKNQEDGAQERRVGRDDDDGDDDNDDDEEEKKKGRNKKEENRRPWRQEMAMRRDPWRRYTFQGETYVHELMDGEAVSEKFLKQIPDHLFEIR